MSLFQHLSGQSGPLGTTHNFEMHGASFPGPFGRVGNAGVAMPPEIDASFEEWEQNTDGMWTANVPLFVRPSDEQNKFDQALKPYDVVFAHTPDSANDLSMVGMLNIPCMNYLLDLAASSKVSPGIRVGGDIRPGTTLAATTIEEFSRKFAWLGVMRNEAAPTGLDTSQNPQRMVNNVVAGEAKVFNIFGSDLSIGDKLYLTVTKKRLTPEGIVTPDGTSAHSREGAAQYGLQVSGMVVRASSAPLHNTADPGFTAGGRLPHQAAYHESQLNDFNVQSFFPKPVDGMDVSFTDPSHCGSPDYTIAFQSYDAMTGDLLGLRRVDVFPLEGFAVRAEQARNELRIEAESVAAIDGRKVQVGFHEGKLSDYEKVLGRLADPKRGAGERWESIENGWRCKVGTVRFPFIGKIDDTMTELALRQNATMQNMRTVDVYLGI